VLDSDAGANESGMTRMISRSLIRRFCFHQNNIIPTTDTNEQQRKIAKHGFELDFE
jgi:hypothetical protein